MDVLYERCCGLDVHKKTVVACFLGPGVQGALTTEIKTFGTMTSDLLALADWLRARQCTHVAMESTGVYWKPVYQILDGQFTLVVANAQEVKTRPGRKTDVKDAQWIADLLRHGLITPSYVPDQAQQDLRDLTRYRTTLVEERARIANRLQKVLEAANIKLAAVATDIQGVSARAMLAALVAGEQDPATLADLARGRLREKEALLRQALDGRVRTQHRFLLAELLGHLDYLDEAIARISAEVGKHLLPFEEEITLLDSIPGISRETAEVILAEIGWSLDRFPTAKQLASWAGLCPGNHESGGKRLSGRTTKGDPWLRKVLVEAAHGASRRTKSDTYFAQQYRRLAARRGKKKALIAVAHSLLVTIFHVLTRQQAYVDLGENYFDQLDRQRVEHRAVKRLEALGYQVSLTPAA